MNRMIGNESDVKVYIMYCSNSVGSAKLDASEIGMHGDEVVMTAIPCSGKLNLLYMVKVFETGADGLVLLTCPSDKCRHMEGNMRTGMRAESVNSLLAETGVDGGRVVVMEMDSSNPERVTAAINEFISNLKSTKQMCGVSA